MQTDAGTLLRSHGEAWRCSRRRLKKKEMKKCKICKRELGEEMFYVTRTKKRTGEGYYIGSRRECKACTLNRSERERDAWRNGTFSVYLLPKENYCGYTNNIRHRINQHRRGGKNVEGYEVVYESHSPIEAHLVETQYHLKGWGGFKINTGHLLMCKEQSSCLIAGAGCVSTRSASKINELDVAL